MDSPKTRDLRRQLEERAGGAFEQAVNQIEGLAQSVDAFKLFVATIANIGFAPAGSISEASHGNIPAKIETLAYYLYPFFERPDNSDVTPWHVSECIDALNTLVAMRLIAGHLPDAGGNGDGVDAIAVLVRMHAEVVRGSAYPEQTGDEVSEIQGAFDQWFAEAVSVSPTRAQAILWAIISRAEQAINSFMPDIREKAIGAGNRWRVSNEKACSERTAAEAKALEIFDNENSARAFELVAALSLIAPNVIPVGIEDLADLDPPPTVEEWDGLIGLVGMTGESRSRMVSPTDVRQRPLYVLPDRRVILTDISNALDALWEAYEQVAKTDQAFFDTRYQRKKARWLEDRVAEVLSGIFPPSSVYRNLTYPDPNKGEGSTTELDAAVLWGPFLLLTESKAKQFRLESQLGDLGRLRTDIKANVEDAFDQARRAAKYIHDAPSPVFTESVSGRQLVIEKDSIRRIYLVTVSQHLLAGLATRLSMFQDLGLFREGEYPFSISIADLETIAQFCDGPDVFLHYVEKRLLTQKETLEIVADELDLFGAYLQTRLQPSRLWDRDGEAKPTYVSLAGFSAQFDDWASYKRGDLSTPPGISLEIPLKIKEVLSELRNRGDSAARWIAFAILDLPDRALGVIAEGLADLRTAALAPGMGRRFVPW